MTLKEARDHALSVAERASQERQESCADEHRQIAAWFDELDAVLAARETAERERDEEAAAGFATSAAYERERRERETAEAEVTRLREALSELVKECSRLRTDLTAEIRDHEGTAQASNAEIYRLRAELEAHRAGAKTAGGLVKLIVRVNGNGSVDVRTPEGRFARWTVDAAQQSVRQSRACRESRRVAPGAPDDCGCKVCQVARAIEEAG
jgi:DNA repair exonuclease SbcCD ATPase subunit